LGNVLALIAALLAPLAAFLKDFDQTWHKLQVMDIFRHKAGSLRKDFFYQRRRSQCNNQSAQIHIMI